LYAREWKPRLHWKAPAICSVKDECICVSCQSSGELSRGKQASVSLKRILLCTCNSSSQEARQKNHEFKANVSYIMRCYPKQKQKNNKNYKRILLECLWFLTMVPKTYVRGKITFSTNSTEKPGHPHIEDWN
jgi:hypothetical protein